MYFWLRPVLLVAALGLTCPVACGILVPQPGIEHAPPCIGRWSLNYWTTKDVPIRSFRGTLWS